MSWKGQKCLLGHSKYIWSEYLRTQFALGKGELQCLQNIAYRNHGQINYTDIKAKCRHLKKFTCKWTSLQVFIRVYRQRYRQSCLYFDPALWTVAPLTFSLVQLSPLLPFPVWISILYIRIQWLGGGGMGYRALYR